MTYSLDVINLAIAHLHTNKSKKEISSILKITRPTLNSWITKYSNNILNMEKVTQKSSSMFHKNNKINKYLESVRLFVNDNIGCSLNDIHEHINKEISKSSICNILKQLNITHKKIQIPHNEQHHIIYVPDEARQQRVSPRAAAWLPHKREHSFADCR